MGSACVSDNLRAQLRAPPPDGTECRALGIFVLRSLHQSHPTVVEVCPPFYCD